MFEFQNPGAFFFLLLVPLLYFLRHIKLFTRISFPLTLSTWNGEDFVYNRKFRKFFSGLIKALCIVGYVSLVVALADPVHHNQIKIYSSRGADIIFVVDVSPSMASQDIAGMSRLEATKKAVNTLVEADTGDAVGLVEMAEDAALVVPPTMDRNFFKERLDSINVGDLGDGTAIGTGLTTAMYHLEKSTAQKKCVVLVTDGENNAGEVHPFTVVRLLKKKDIAFYVLGIGTKGTVFLEYADPKTGYVYSGYLESNFDGASLARLASEADGKYFEIESMQTLAQVLSTVSKNETIVQSYHIKNYDTKYYSRFLIIAAFCFVFAWIFRKIFLQEAI